VLIERTRARQWKINFSSLFLDNESTMYTNKNMMEWSEKISQSEARQRELDSNKCQQCQNVASNSKMLPPLHNSVLQWKEIERDARVHSWNVGSTLCRSALYFSRIQNAGRIPCKYKDAIARWVIESKAVGKEHPRRQKCH
jgi:hypothetical protein